MKGETKYITQENFLSFLYDVEPNINFFNQSYVSNIKFLYFKTNCEQLPFYKAKKSLKNILKEQGCISKSYAYTKEYWYKLGYLSDDEIRTKIYSYLSKIDQKKYDMCFDNDNDKFDFVLKKYFVEFNFDNVEYRNSLHDYVFNDNICLPVMNINKKLRKIIKVTGTQLSKDYWLYRGFDDTYASEKISSLQKERSIRCENYYINKGYDSNEAKMMVSDKQRKYSLCGKGKVKYWLDLGFDDSQAEKIAKEFSRKSSVRCTEYWMSLGYSESEASKKVKEYNPSSEDFVDYKNDIRLYTEKIKRCKESGTNVWKNKNTRDKLIHSFKFGKVRCKSNSEDEMFNFLIDNVDNRIKHEPYIVVIPDNCEIDTQNAYFYSCDGYLELKNGVIIIEYDGVIYHDDERDTKRDDDILYLDKSIVGVLRIGQYYIKGGDINNKIKKLKDALQRIENSTETRIVLK